MMRAQCDMSDGVLDLIEEMITRKPAPEQLPVMFLDGGCNTVTESLAALTGQLYNATMVNHRRGVRILPDGVSYITTPNTIPAILLCKVH